MIFGREPALITGFIAIAINLGVSFGLHLTGDQIALLNAAIVAFMAVIVRQVVTPVADPRLAPGTIVTPTTGGEPTVISAGRS